MGEEDLADDLDDALHSAEAAGSVPLDKNAVDDERDEPDEDEDHAGEDENELLGEDGRDDGQEDPTYYDQDAHEDAHPAEDGHGSGEPELAAAVTLQSELVQHDVYVSLSVVCFKMSD